MSTVLKLTVATGETHDVPFTQQSTVSIKTQVAGDNGGLVQKEFSYSGVVAFEIVDVDTGAAALAVDTTPGMETPEAAIHFAKEMPLADAAAHIEKAIAKFGDHDGLHEIAQDIHRAVQAGEETFTTNVNVPDPAVEQPQAPAADTAEAALETIKHLQTADEALVAADAALEKWPTNADLLAVKEQAEGVIAARPPAVDSATLETPAAAIKHAEGLDITEAAAHVDAALAKFPDNADLLALKDEIAAVIAADAQA